jgi:hypothetical protein
MYGHESGDGIEAAYPETTPPASSGTISAVTSDPPEPNDEPVHNAGTRLTVKVQIGAIAAWLALFAVVTQVPRLWGSQWLWEHARFVGPLLAVAVINPIARLLARLWPSAPVERQAAIGESDVAALQRRVARKVRWYRARRALVWVVVLLIPILFVSGQIETDNDQRLIDTQPHRIATVVKVYRSPMERVSIPDVTVELDGQAVQLALSFPGDSHVQVGDRLTVVQDPDHPSYVLATTSHNDWAYNVWGTVALYLAVGTFLVWVAYRGIPKRRALRAGRAASSSKRLAIESVGADFITLTDDAGCRWEWRISKDWDGPRYGHVLAVGTVRDGGWVVLGTNGKRCWWPKAGLRPQTGCDVAP